MTDRGRGRGRRAGGRSPRSRVRFAGSVGGLALGALAAAVLGAPWTAPAGVPPAAAAPAAVERATQPTQGALPIAVTLDRIDPLEVRPDSTITVIARLTNTGSTDTGPLRVRLQRGALITTRSELAQADVDPPATATAFAPSLPLAISLAPGQSTRLSYRCTAADLALHGLGVYPVAFEARATVDGVTTDVGRLQTLLPFFPNGVMAKPTKVAWLWPLLDRPHRLVGDGGPAVFADDALAASVAAGGRLDQLLTAAEQATARRVRLTLVLDPETIDALTLMTKGYRVQVGARKVPGVGQRAAGDWLARLRAVAVRQVVAVVPYADPDIVALNRGDISDLGRLEQSDLEGLDRALTLPVTPSRLAWPPGGLLTDGALDDLVDQGMDAVVLDSSALPHATRDQTPTPSAVSPLPALRGQTVALVTDAELQKLVAKAAGKGAGTRLAEQRYLAELAMLTAQEPGEQRTYVIAPPRRWTPSPTYAAAVLSDLAAVSWLTSVTVPDAVAGTAPVDRGPLSYPSGAQRAELPASQVQRIADVQGKVADFRSALTNADANTLLSGYGDALRWAASSVWRDNPGPGRAYVTALGRSIDALRGQVSIVVPTTGIYTLTSSSSPLSLTVRNDLPVPVKISLRIDTAAAAGFRAPAVNDQAVPARSRATLRVPVQVQRAGTFAIPVFLTTPRGGTLNGVRLTVRSTAYGALALGITGAALIVLIAAVAARLVRRLRAANGAPPPPGTPADRRLR